MTVLSADWIAPSLEDITTLAEQAYAGLPDEFLRVAGPVVIHVEDFADDETLDEMAIADPFELSGLYRGVDLTRRSVSDPEPQTAHVFLYRRPILDEWAERGDLSIGQLVTHVLVHEIGHHFGLSDADIHRIEDEA
jgi:predicted Zn-dependent protease with MMP-like domain